MSSILFVMESKPMRSLKDKYKIDKKLSLQKDVLKETSFCSIGLGELKENKLSSESHKTHN